VALPPDRQDTGRIEGVGGGHHGGGLGAVEAVAAGDSPVHRLDPRVKILGLIGLVLVAVTLPAGSWAAFGALAVILVGLAAASRLQPLYLLRRMTIDLPFLLAAAILPFTAEDGLMLGVTVALKVSISVLAMVILSSTTPFPSLLRGFEMLGTPRLILTIVAFMWRYLHVLAAEVSRMQTARAARGYSAGWLWQAASTGPLIATLFVRSLERGERVHLAMRSRLYDGSMPRTATGATETRTTDVLFLTSLAVVLVLIVVVLA
jgi:cobalt/nickel transport system permease protein